MSAAGVRTARGRRRPPSSTVASSMSSSLGDATTADGPDEHPDGSAMRLEVITPATVVVDVPATKVSAETTAGWHTLLCRHVDVVATLLPGLLSYVAAADAADGPDSEHLVAIDGGLLVKRGRFVRVVVGQAAPGDDVLELQRALRSSFAAAQDAERRARTAIDRLEADAIRRLMELERE